MEARTGTSVGYDGGGAELGDAGRAEVDECAEPPAPDDREAPVGAVPAAVEAPGVSPGVTPGLPVLRGSGAAEPDGRAVPPATGECGLPHAVAAKTAHAAATAAATERARDSRGVMRCATARRAGT
jgi:hypothetical protein